MTSASRAITSLPSANHWVVTPAQAERLFQAGSQPKELRWYDAGHRLPPAAADDAAEWLPTAFAFSTFSPQYKRSPALKPSRG